MVPNPSCTCGQDPCECRPLIERMVGDFNTAAEYGVLGLLLFGGFRLIKRATR